MYKFIRPCAYGILVGLFALTTLSRTAGAETLKWRQGLRITRVESTAIGDLPGPVVGIGDSSGVAFFENGDVASTGTHFAFFYTDGSGPAEAFAPFTFEDGSTFVVKFGSIAKANKADNTTTFKGKFSFVYGSGRFAGIKGNGSVSGRRFAPLGSGAVLYFDYTATYTLP
jgi:hypothetical protein